MMGNYHVQCGARENLEIVSKDYLLLLGKKNQKPLLSTRFVLDEVGNLQSDGHGISDLERTLSIGLGQEQFLLLVLQTLQRKIQLVFEAVHI